MRFADIQHQQRAISLLRRGLRSGRTPHAYLFAGPDGVGKERTAMALTARLLCLDEGLAPDADACGGCASCRLLAGGNHPDFHLLHRGLHKLHPDRAVRARKGLFLTVDLVRHFLIDAAATKPTTSPRRVFLIRDAERMNEEAQNALLKTLEEPPGAACLILVTSSAARLLPTIRSRCQHVPFDLLPTAFVEQRLVQEARVDPLDARTLAALSGGRLGAALRWWRIGLLKALDELAAVLAAPPEDDPEGFAKQVVATADALARRAERSDEADGTAADDQLETEDEEVADAAGGKAVATDALRDALKLVLLLIAALQRDALVVRSRGAGELLNLPGQRARVERIAAYATAVHLDDALGAIARAEEMIDRNVAPQLACERLAVALGGTAPIAAG